MEGDSLNKTKFLIDSDILIDFSKKIQQAADFLEKFFQLSQISIISWMELIVGARSPQEIEYLEGFLSKFPTVGISREIGELCYKLLKSYNKSIGLNILDAMIAAITISSNCILVTRNAKHFEKITELEIMVPY